VIDKLSVKQVVELGFKKLAIHQTSYSGLGSKSGGPLGGRKQESEYKIDCRWSPEYIGGQIEQHNMFMKKIEIRNGMCTNFDFEDLINENDTEAIMYLDPPYYVKGNDLYQFGFTEEDHIRLAKLLRNTKHKWLLSYDDCDEVRQLYDWANIIRIGDISYTITTKTSIKKSELLITKEGVDLDELCWF
jgi:DNA adenine methylase